MTQSKAPNIPLLWLFALVSIGVIATALAGMAITARAGAWLTFAFQCTIVLAGALGVMQGLRKISDAPALASCCVAGTFFVAGFLGYFGAGGQIAFRSLLAGNLDVFDAGKLPTWIFVVDLGAAALVGVIAGLFALGRSPKNSWQQLAMGVALGAPVLLGAAAAYKGQLAQRLASLNMIVATLIVVTLFIVFVGLIAASANAIIKAFATGLPDLDAPDSNPKTKPNTKPKANTTPAASKAG